MPSYGDTEPCSVGDLDATCFELETLLSRLRGIREAMASRNIKEVRAPKASLSRGSKGYAAFISFIEGSLKDVMRQPDAIVTLPSGEQIALEMKMSGPSESQIRALEKAANKPKKGRGRVPKK